MTTQLPANQMRFLSHAITLEEAAPPRTARLTTLLAVSLVVGAIAWASVTRLPQVASATGQIIPAGSVLPIQHLEGGVVEEILVAEGALVDEGQVLVRLSDAAALSELNQTKTREAALASQAE